MRRALAILALWPALALGDPITRTNGPFTGFQNGGSGTTFTVTSVACTAGTTVLLSLAYTNATNDSVLDTPTASGGGLSWSSATARVTADTHCTTMFFWADCPGGISSQTITITHQSNGNGTWAWASIEAFSGTNTAAPIGATAVNNAANSQPATVTVDFSGTGRTQSYLALVGVDYATNSTTLGAVDGNSTALVNDSSGATEGWTQRRTSLVDAGSYTLTRAFSGTDRWAASAIELKAALVAATPTSSLASGTYYTPQTVTLSCASPSPTIRYTTDGSTPTSGSAAYSTPLAVGYPETAVQAICQSSGLADSPVVGWYYPIGSAASARRGLR
jgi:hypothetical protein